MPNDFNLSTFRNAIHHIGRNQYFDISIPGVSNRGDVLTALCRSTTMPPKSHETIDVYYRGLPMKIDGRATFDTWTVTFLSDEGQQTRNVFMKWMEKAYSVSLLENKPHNAYKQDNVVVRKLAADKSVVTQINFWGMWPTSVGEVELNQEGGAVEQFEVTFTYDFWLLGMGVGNIGRTDIEVTSTGIDIPAVTKIEGITVNITPSGTI